MSGLGMDAPRVRPYAPTDVPRLAVSSPRWFDEAVRYPVTSHYVLAGGCRVHYLLWAGSRVEPDAPGLLLVHGGGAHVNWWRFIAPFFADQMPVVAMDLSGMGESDARASYSASIRAGEIAAVLEDAGFFAPRRAPPLIVGHSFGGLTAMRYAAEHGEQLGGFVIAESPVRTLEAERAHFSARPDVAPQMRRYDDFASALARFRLRPRQRCRHPYIVEWIGRHSIRAVDGAWSWKFDPAALTRDRHAEPFRDYLAAVTCPTALMFGENSALTSPDVVDYMATIVVPSTPVVMVPQGQHHLFLDEPLACVAALRAILAGWGSYGPG